MKRIHFIVFYAALVVFTSPAHDVFAEQEFSANDRAEFLSAAMTMQQNTLQRNEQINRGWSDQGHSFGDTNVHDDPFAQQKAVQRQNFESVMNTKPFRDNPEAANRMRANFGYSDWPAQTQQSNTMRIPSERNNNARLYLQSVAGSSGSDRSSSMFNNLFGGSDHDY